MNKVYNIPVKVIAPILTVSRKTSSMNSIEKEIVKKKSKKVLTFLKFHLGDAYESTYFLASSENFDIYKLERASYPSIVNLERVNRKRRINKFFEACNFKLPEGGLYIGSVETYAMRRRILIKKYPNFINWIVYLIDTIFHRIFPKLSFTQKFYFYLTKGKNRMLSRAETFGRLYSCGFEIIAEEEIGNELFFVAKKIGIPSFDHQATYGPLIKLRRVGKDGKIFRVYKLRTMYPYSEYLQDYVFKNHQLDEGGKFKNDFRVSPLGRFFRKFWLDEIPMIWNLLKGDMKIIGVRPLSNQYFNLYTKELQEKRIRTKPGLLPPFYADMPKTLEEIMDSELKYLEAYEKAPLATDLKYFWLILKNILFRGARSK